MKSIGFILNPFVDNFMTRFTTTIGRDIYVPSREWCNDTEKYIEIVCHEVFHVRQEEREIEKYGKLLGKLSFKLKYLYPQINALPSLLALLSVLYLYDCSGFIYFVSFLVFLVFLIPKLLKARWRYDYEVEGYAGNVLFHYWYNNRSIEEFNYSGIIKNLKGSNYYWSNSGASDFHIKKDIMECANYIKDDSLNLMEENRYLFGIKQIIKEP